MTNLRFREDGSFRVLQMADIQDGPNVLPDTIRLIREAIRKADPDLVVFTGDQIRGYDPAYIDTFLRRRGETGRSRACGHRSRGQAARNQAAGQKPREQSSAGHEV